MKRRALLIKPALVASLALILILLSGRVVPAAPGYLLAKVQTIYVPVYSNIFSAPRKIPFNLATILSIRNTDMSSHIIVVAADYYDTRGKLVRRYYQNPLRLGPLESTEIYIPEADTKGRTGANFIVKWYAPREVNAPIVESVMIGMESGQGISFVSPGREIRDTGR